jgi:WD40 repeat protein
LLSWSHDGSLRVWDVARARQVQSLEGHADRVVAATLSPDGAWAVSAARDGIVKFWELGSASESGSATLDAEVRGCFFLPGGRSLAVVLATGKLRVLAFPDWQVEADLDTFLPLQCGQLAPSGGQVALGGADGRVYFASVGGCEPVPLGVVATRSSRPSATRLQRLFGKHGLVEVLSCTCPACRHTFELSEPPTECPNCRRPLQVRSTVPA